MLPATSEELSCPYNHTTPAGGRAQTTASRFLQGKAEAKGRVASDRARQGGSGPSTRAPRTPHSSSFSPPNHGGSQGSPRPASVATRRRGYRDSRPKQPGTLRAPRARHRRRREGEPRHLPLIDARRFRSRPRPPGKWSPRPPAPSPTLPAPRPPRRSLPGERRHRSARSLTPMSRSADAKPLAGGWPPARPRAAAGKGRGWMRRRCEGARGPARTRRPGRPQSGGDAEGRRARGADGARGRPLLPGFKSGFRKPGRRPHDNRRRGSEVSAPEERVGRPESEFLSLPCGRVSCQGSARTKWMRRPERRTALGTKGTRGRGSCGQTQTAWSPRESLLPCGGGGGGGRAAGSQPGAGASWLSARAGCPPSLRGDPGRTRTPALCKCSCLENGGNHPFSPLPSCPGRHVYHRAGSRW